jgi:glucan phosphoethanolaminetransferase (alkaline phosphatase superfamily)
MDESYKYIVSMLTYTAALEKCSFSMIPKSRHAIPDISIMSFETRYVAIENEKPQQEPAHWSRTLIAIAIAFVVVATISFLLRLYSRRKTTWKPAIEDVFLGIGLSFSYLLSACVIIGTDGLIL